jgi:hypothetical protein
MLPIHFTTNYRDIKLWLHPAARCICRACFYINLIPRVVHVPSGVNAVAHTDDQRAPTAAIQNARRFGNKHSSRVILDSTYLVSSFELTTHCGLTTRQDENNVFGASSCRDVCGSIINSQTRSSMTQPRTGQLSLPFTTVAVIII